MYQAVLILHLLGATLWTGGHILLSLTVLPEALRKHDPNILLAFEQRYERVGMSALLVQVISGFWLAHHWLPDAAAWWGFGNPVSAMISTKLLLLLATVLTALHARLRVIPRLDAQRLPFMALHVALVTLFSILFVIAGVGLRTGGFL